MRFAPFIVSCCEECLEAGPRFLFCGKTFPGFAVFYKEIGPVDELERNADDLFEAVGSVTGGGVIFAVFYYVKKGFNWLVYVIRGAEDSVVFLEIRGGDVGIGGV